MKDLDFLKLQWEGVGTPGSESSNELLGPPLAHALLTCCWLLFFAIFRHTASSTSHSLNNSFHPAYRRYMTTHLCSGKQLTFYTVLDLCFSKLECCGLISRRAKNTHYKLVLQLEYGGQNNFSTILFFYFLPLSTTHTQNSNAHTRTCTHLHTFTPS